MSLSVCMSCLARLRLSTAIVPSTVTTTSRTSAFHNSAIHLNVLKKKATPNSGRQPVKYRESRGARVKKKKVKERARPPAIGERKALRKRIVLSNTNALEVPQIEKLSPENMADSGKIGQMLALNGELLDQLRDAKAFQTNQNWAMFRTPSTLVREESIVLGTQIQEINASRSNTQNNDQSSQQRTIQTIVEGARGCGKSIHLVQAMSVAYLNKWIVINIPDARAFVSNTSAYAPSKEDQSNEKSYVQPQLASELLSRIAHSNAGVLSSLKPMHNHEDLPRSISKMKSLHELAMLGADEPSVALSIWEALWKELSVASKNPDANTTRPPVLVAIDGIDHWMGPTLYRTSEYSIIHAHQFVLIRQFLNLLFSENKNPLLNGGIVLAATTRSNSPTFPSFEMLCRQIEARKTMEITDPKFPMPQPYEKVDQRVFDLLGSTAHLGLTSLRGLSKLESRGLLDYFARSGVFRESVTESIVGEKWTLSGGGIIGQLCKLGSRVRLGDLETRRNQSARSRQ